MGCGSWQRVGEKTAPDPQGELTQLFDSDALYSRLGRLVSSDQISYIGSLAYVPGPADSTRAIVALSLANREFAFEKDGTGFGAHYRVDYTFARTGAAPVSIGRDQAIRVATFQETTRSDESIILQQQVNLLPGDYTVTVKVRDLGNTQVGTATRKVTVPAFTDGSYTAPILTYQVKARTSRDDSLQVVMNPRGTIAYGGDTLLIYLEGVGFHRPTSVPFEVRDDHDSVVVRSAVQFTGARPLETAYVRLAPDSVPLGELQIALGAPQQVRSTSALVSFSAAWVVTNFDDLISLLRYFGEGARLSKIAKAQATDKAVLWREFYHDTDPVPSTPNNEALELYFARVAVANQRFRGEGIPGWRTDRGEVFIVLGPPDQTYDASPTIQNAGRYYQWDYFDYHIQLIFQDQTGFGRFRLDPGSRSDFERIRVRVQGNH